ncbi:hypothetical protein PG989_015033 [Apiospora arundinis]
MSNDTKPGVPLYLAGLIDLYDFERPQEVSFEKIAGELEDLSSANQGTEFPGTPNDRLAVELFRDQSQPWGKIAQYHVRLVLDMSRHFVNELVGYIVSPSAGKAFSAILADVVDPFFEMKSQVLEQKVNELLHHYRTGHPQPLDTEFRMLLTARRRKNLEAEVLDKLLRDQPELFKAEALEKLRRVTHDANASKCGIEGLIERSETYYKMALRTFIDNVMILAIENCLVQDIPSIFTTEMVSQMDDAELDRLASESEDIRDERVQLQKEPDALKEGLKYCNRYQERGIPFIPAVVVHLDTVSSHSATTVGKVAPSRSPSATSRSTTDEAVPPRVPGSKMTCHDTETHKPNHPTNGHKVETIPIRSGNSASCMKQAPTAPSSAGMNQPAPASALPPGGSIVGSGSLPPSLGSGVAAGFNSAITTSNPPQTTPLSVPGISSLRSGSTAGSNNATTIPSSLQTMPLSVPGLSSLGSGYAAGTSNTTATTSYQQTTPLAVSGLSNLGSGSAARPNNATTISSSPQTMLWAVPGLPSQAGPPSSSPSLSAPGAKQGTAGSFDLFGFPRPLPQGPVQSTILPKSNLTLGSTVPSNGSFQTTANPLGFPTPKQTGRQADPVALGIAYRLALHGPMILKSFDGHIERFDNPCPEICTFGPYYSLDEIRLAFLNSLAGVDARISFT